MILVLQTALVQEFPKVTNKFVLISPGKLLHPSTVVSTTIQKLKAIY